MYIFEKENLLLNTHKICTEVLSFSVRSLASVALRKAERTSFHFNYFTVDLQEVTTSNTLL